MAEQVLVEVNGQETVSVPRVKDVTYSKLDGLTSALDKTHPIEVPVHYALMGEAGQVLNTVPAPRYKAIIERDNHAIIYGIVSKKYTLINHKDIMERVIPQLVQAGLVHQHTDINKGRMFSFWLTPKARTVKVGDLVQFGVMIRNAIDGSMGFGIEFYSLRLACMNGAVHKTAIGEGLYKKHIGADLDMLEELIANALTKIDGVVQLYKSATTTNLPTEKIVQVVSSMFLPDGIKKELQAHPISNIWDAFNELTAKITRSHASTPTKYQYYQEAERLLRLVSP